MTTNTSRRRFVRSSVAAALGAALVACGPSGSARRRGLRWDPTGFRTLRYGSYPNQVGDLYLPAAAGDRVDLLPVVVLVHGGFWLDQFGRDLMAGLAADAVSQSWAAWNVEYRRLGQDGGGWPGTFTDVAAAVDHVGELSRPAGAGARLDRGRVAVVGHSAGGQLAVWAAGRAGLPSSAPGASPALEPIAAVSQAGVLDLVGAANEGVGGSAVAELMGGGPDDVPGRYQVGSPLARVPIGAPVRCVHGRGDANVPLGQSERYVAAARQAGAEAALAPFDGDHSDVLDPRHRSWTDTVAWLHEQFTR